MLNQINDNRKIGTYYSEMEEFLLTYILSEKYDECYEKIVRLYIEYKKNKIKYCYNTKTKLDLKEANEKELVTYCLLAGKIDEAVEIFLRNEKYPFKYDKNMPVITKDINSRQVIVCKYKEDCIVRNLYVIFQEMEYTNGLKFIDICKERPYDYIDYQLASLKDRRDNFEKVKAWTGLFIPVFNLYKKDGYFKENIEIKGYISFEDKGNISEDRFKEYVR